MPVRVVGQVEAWAPVEVSAIIPVGTAAGTGATAPAHRSVVVRAVGLQATLRYLVVLGRQEPTCAAAAAVLAARPSPTTSRGAVAWAGPVGHAVVVEVAAVRGRA